MENVISFIQWQWNWKWQRQWQWSLKQDFRTFRNAMKEKLLSVRAFFIFIFLFIFCLNLIHQMWNTISKIHNKLNMNMRYNCELYHRRQWPGKMKERKQKKKTHTNCTLCALMYRCNYTQCAICTHIQSNSIPFSSEFNPIQSNKNEYMRNQFK